MLIFGDVFNNTAEKTSGTQGKADESIFAFLPTNEYPVE